MKVVALREAKQQLSEWAKTAQEDAVLITKHGKPWAFLTGAGVYDWEDITTMGDPKFWKKIERARKRPTRPIAEVRKRFGLPATPARRVKKDRR